MALQSELSQEPFLSADELMLDDTEAASQCSTKIFFKTLFNGCALNVNRPIFHSDFCQDKIINCNDNYFSFGSQHKPTVKKLH